MDRRGYVLGSLEVPVETGGHLPGLMSDQAAIPSLPEIEYGEGRVGRFEGQRFDMTAFLDLEVSLRVYQHSLVEDSAFFTLLDDLCLGTNQDLRHKALLQFGDPDDWGLDSQKKKEPGLSPGSLSGSIRH
jgi:hypothetical protein